MLCFPFVELSTKLNRSKMALLATRAPVPAASRCTDASSRASQELLCNRRKGGRLALMSFPPFAVEGRDRVSPSMFSLSCDGRWMLSCESFLFK